MIIVYDFFWVMLCLRFFKIPYAAYSVLEV